MWCETQSPLTPSIMEIIVLLRPHFACVVVLLFQLRVVVLLLRLRVLLYLQHLLVRLRLVQTPEVGQLRSGLRAASRLKHRSGGSMAYVVTFGRAMATGRQRPEKRRWDGNECSYCLGSPSGLNKCAPSRAPTGAQIVTYGSA